MITSANRSTSRHPRVRTLALGCAGLALALALAGCKGNEAPTDAPSTEATGDASGAVTAADPVVFVKDYLASELGDDVGNVHVNTARVDLDGDGNDEVLAYASGMMMCGSGGCNLLVLSPDSEKGYRVVGDLSVVQLPVGVLDSSTNGWRDLAVSVSGGGIPASIRRVPFDGKAYASNPTTAGAGEPDSIGTALITTDDLMTSLEKKGDRSPGA